MKLYIGVVGQIAAGKEVFAEYLIKKFGYTTFSLSTVLHLELEKRNVKKYTRKTLQDLGDEMRQKYGNDILAKKAVEILNTNHRPVVITGIRNPVEIKYLQTLPHFKLVAVKAQRKIRFQRVLKRSKPWDPKTWSAFYQIDRRDYGIGQDQSGQQVGECIKLANYVLTNNKDMGNFYKQIEKLIVKIKVKS